MKFFLALLCSVLVHTSLFAISPFSLEEIRGVNITVLNKSGILDEPLVQSIEKQIAAHLLALGIATSSKRFSNLLIKLDHLKGTTPNVCHVTLSLVENGTFTRAKPIEALAISYTKDDLFECTDVKKEIAESIEFLVDEFIDQYKDENKPPKK